MDWQKVHFPWNWMKKNSDEEWKERTALFEKFINFFGFDYMAHAGYIGSYERLLHGKRSYNHVKAMCYYPRGWKQPEVPPCHDHAYVFKIKGTKRIVYVSQPYAYKLTDIKELEVWCNERDLIYVICNNEFSFYFPKNTELILIMSNDTYIDFIGDLRGFPAIWQQCTDRAEELVEQYGEECRSLILDTLELIERGAK